MNKYLVTGRKLIPKYRNAFAATLSTGGPFSCVESRLREWVVDGDNEEHVRSNWAAAKAFNFKAVKGYDLISVELISENPPYAK